MLRAIPGLLALLLAIPAAAAERVVTLAPHLAELVCEAGGCERLVGVAAYTDTPPAAAAKPQVGNAFAVSLENLLALRPDWILAWDGGTPPATIGRLRDLGLQVDVIAIRGLDDIGRALQRIGAGIGTQMQAEAAARDYRARLAALRERYRDRPRLRVFYQIETAPAYTINRRSPISEALALCGADNVFADLPMIAGTVGAEAVMAARPQVVVYTTQEDAEAMRQYWRRFPQIPAARQQVVVDANLLTRQSPRVLEGVAELCEGLDRVRAARTD